jgi:hypothetical protein
LTGRTATLGIGVERSPVRQVHAVGTDGVCRCGPHPNASDGTGHCERIEQMTVVDLVVTAHEHAAAHARTERRLPAPHLL